MCNEPWIFGKDILCISTIVQKILSMMGEGFEHRAAGFLLKKELTYFSKVSSTHFSTKK